MSDDPQDPKDEGEPDTDPVVIPFRKRSQSQSRRSGDAEDREPQTLEDGTVLDRMGREWTFWSIGDNPRQSTCLGCFEQRRKEHEPCRFAECDCFCMCGKRWPIWALFGLLPPKDPPIPPQLLDLGAEQDPKKPAQADPERPRVARVHRSASTSAGALAAAVVLGLLAGKYLPPSKEQPPTASSSTPANVPGLQAEATAAVPPPAGPASVHMLSGGLKMPDKPDPRWLKPDKDGICRNHESGEKLRPQFVVRGACWFVFRKMEGRPSCPDWLYDPPPEVMNDKDPMNAGLKESCFQPWGADGTPQALKP